MGLREILIITGILVILVIIWDARKYIQRGKSDPSHVKHSILPALETDPQPERKTDKAPLLAKLSSDDVQDNDKQACETQSTPIQADTRLTQPPLPIDTAPTHTLRNNTLVATIGEKTQIIGTVKGQEDLLVDGIIIGDVMLKNSTITIGIHGQVIGDIYANSVYVQGIVKGTVVAAERIALRNYAQVLGDLISPSLSIEDGARFQGSTRQSSA